jgi:hypothetical protein
MPDRIPPLLALALGVVVSHPIAAQQNRIDIVTPAARELAAFGAHAVG